MQDLKEMTLTFLWKLFGGPTMQIWQTTTVIYFTAYWAS